MLTSTSLLRRERQLLMAALQHDLVDTTPHPNWEQTWKTRELICYDQNIVKHVESR
jgi:hypothetical protein